MKKVPMLGRILMIAFCMLFTMHTPAFSADLDTRSAIQQLYVGYLGRGADQAGLDYWVNDIDTGVMTMEQLRSNLTNEQPEYLHTYGGLNRVELVSRIYQNLFEREPEADGLIYWAYGEGASVNADQLIVAFLNSPSPSDQIVLNNKLEAAIAYTNQQGSSILNFIDAIEAQKNASWTLSRFTVIYSNGTVIDSTQPDVSASGTMTLTGTRLTQSFDLLVYGQSGGGSLSGTITGTDGQTVFLRNDNSPATKLVVINDNPLMTLTLVDGYTEVDQWVPSLSLMSMSDNAKSAPEEKDGNINGAPLGGFAGNLIEIK